MWFQRFKQFFCQLFGHDDSICYGPGRIWLRCEECGRKTPGWHWDLRKELLIKRTSILYFSERISRVAASRRP